MYIANFKAVQEVLAKGSSALVAKKESPPQTQFEDLLQAVKTLIETPVETPTEPPTAVPKQKHTLEAFSSLTEIAAIWSMWQPLIEQFQAGLMDLEELKRRLSQDSMIGADAMQALAAELTNEPAAISGETRSLSEHHVREHSPLPSDSMAAASRNAEQFKGSSDGAKPVQDKRAAVDKPVQDKGAAVDKSVQDEGVNAFRTNQAFRTPKLETLFDQSPLQQSKLLSDRAVNAKPSALKIGPSSEPFSDFELVQKMNSHDKAAAPLSTNLLGLSPETGLLVSDDGSVVNPFEARDQMTLKPWPWQSGQQLDQTIPHPGTDSSARPAVPAQTVSYWEWLATRDLSFLPAQGFAAAEHSAVPQSVWFGTSDASSSTLTSEGLEEELHVPLTNDGVPNPKNLPKARDAENKSLLLRSEQPAEELEETVRSDPRPQTAALDSNQSQSRTENSNGTMPPNTTVLQPMNAPPEGPPEAANLRSVLPEEVTAQIVDRMQLITTAERGEVRIQLQPEFLGNVRIRIVVEQGVVTAQFAAENQAVREVIQSQLGQLRSNLEEMGLNIEHVSVDVGGDSAHYTPEQQQEAQQRMSQSNNEAAESSAEHALGHESSPSKRSSISADGTVNVRI